MLKWLKTWLKNTARSAYDPSFYKEMAKKKYPKALRHLYGTLWITSLGWSIGAAIAVFGMIPHINAFVHSVTLAAPTLYPQELIIHISHGEVATNVQEPYFIEIPMQWRQPLTRNDADPLLHLVTIDTNAHAEDFSRYHSVLLITKRSLVMPDKNNTIKIYSLEKVEDLTINKAFYDKFVETVLPFLNLLPALTDTAIVFLLLFFPFVMAGLGMIGMFIYLVFAVAVLWVIAMFVGPQRRYGELYRLSLYGLTPALIYRLLEIGFRFHVDWVFTLIYLGWMAYVLHTMKGVKAKA